MIYLQDNDFLLKLGAWNLLEPAMQVLRALPNNVRILDTLAAQLQEPRPDWQTQYGDAVIKRVLNFVGKVPPIGNMPYDIAELVTLNRVPKIDVGEALLFAVTANLPAYRVVTGDKQCLYALHNAPACAPIATRLRGNVLHLEQIVYRLVEEKGVVAIRNAVRHSPAPEADLRIRGAFGRQWDARSDAVSATMLQSIRQLHTDCGELLELSDTECDPFAYL